MRVHTTRPAATRALALLLLSTSFALALPAAAVKSVPCTLEKPAKVTLKAGKPKTLPAGTRIDVLEFGTRWNKVSTPLGDGKIPSPLVCTKEPEAAAVPEHAAETAPAPAPVAQPAPVVDRPTESDKGDNGDKKRGRRLAVYQLEHAGIEDRVAVVLTDSVVAELRKLERTTVVGMDEIKAMLDLEAQKQMMGCTDASCLAEIAEALGVDGVIIGNVAVVGDGITFGLKHIDQRSAQTRGQSTRRLESNDPVDALAAVGPMVEELFPDVPLKPGATRGVDSALALRIHPPPLSPWVVWSLGGVAGVATATGVGLTVLNAVTYASAEAKSAESVEGKVVDGPELVSDINTVRMSFVGLVVAYSAAAVVGAGTGVAALFTDWQGVGE